MYGFPIVINVLALLTLLKLGQAGVWQRMSKVLGAAVWARTRGERGSGCPLLPRGRTCRGTGTLRNHRLPARGSQSCTKEGSITLVEVT